MYNVASRLLCLVTPLDSQFSETPRGGSFVLATSYTTLIIHKTFYRYTYTWIPKEDTNAKKNQPLPSFFLSFNIHTFLSFAPRPPPSLPVLSVSGTGRTHVQYVPTEGFGDRVASPYIYTLKEKKKKPLKDR